MADAETRDSRGEWQPEDAPVISPLFDRRNPAYEALTLWIYAGLTPSLWHTGFHKILFKNGKELNTEHYFHCLHHRFFTVNFGH